MFYHLTNKENVESIIRTGLVPRYGANSDMCSDDKGFVYLCGFHAVDYWSWLLNKDTIIGFEIHQPLKLEYTWYGSYSEFRTTSRFHVFNTTVSPVTRKDWVLPILHKGYSETLGHLCQKVLCEMMQFGTLNLQTINEVYSVVQVCSRIHLDCADKQAVYKHLREYGDEGETTFLDMFEMTSVPLYEQLLKYNDSRSALARELLYATINSIL